MIKINLCYILTSLHLEKIKFFVNNEEGVDFRARGKDNRTPRRPQQTPDKPNAPN